MAVEDFYCDYENQYTTNVGFVFCSAYIQEEISLVPSNPIKQTLELFVPSFEDICFIYF